MIYSDSEHTKIIQPILIKSAGFNPLYELCCDHDSGSSPTSARNVTYPGKTLKAVFKIAAVEMTSNVPTSSDNYGKILTTSTSTGASQFYASKYSITLLRSYNGGMTGYAAYGSTQRQGSYITPASIKNNSGNTWYVVIAALIPGGYSGTVQMGIFNNLDSPNVIPSTSPTRTGFNSAVDGFPCRTATRTFTCASGKGFMGPGINWSNPGSGYWFGNILIGISL